MEFFRQVYLSGCIDKALRQNIRNSYIFFKEKSKVFDILLDDAEYYEVARTFGDLEMTQEEIGNAGLKLMVRWYVISL